MNKLPSIMIGVDFYRKARNRKWIQDNGAEAVIVLQEVWIASSQERDCKIRKEECPYLPFPIPVSPEKVISILESAVTVGLLDADGEFFFNSQIVADHLNFAQKQFNYKEARKKRESTENPPRIQGESSENPPRIIVNSEYEERTEKSEDLKRGSAEGEPPIADCLVQLETYVFVEDYRIPELEMWFKNAGFSNPKKAIEYAAIVVNGHYDSKTPKFDSRHRPAKAFSDMISWGNRAAQELKKANLDAKIAEARLKKANSSSQAQGRPRPPVVNPEAVHPKNLSPVAKELLSLTGLVPTMEAE